MRNWLVDYRRRAKHTRATAARAIGITYQGYVYIETGKRRPSVELAKKIGDVFNFDWTLFFKD